MVYTNCYMLHAQVQNIPSVYLIRLCVDRFSNTSFLMKREAQTERHLMTVDGTTHTLPVVVAFLHCFLFFTICNVLRVFVYACDGLHTEILYFLILFKILSSKFNSICTLFLVFSAKSYMHCTRLTHWSIVIDMAPILWNVSIHSPAFVATAFILFLVALRFWPIIVLFGRSRVPPQCMDATNELTNCFAFSIHSRSLNASPT